MHYDDFCARPALHWARIQRFLGLSETIPLPQELVKSSTIGRSNAHDLSIFPDADRAAVRDLTALVEKRGQPG
ncbi:hypothetical protein JI664_01020 [Rhodobacter sp. NTK016B]|uniref:hypothetical protein n=1 Tax=Rhodobacter sp. NTK016B TaxID=2759676 RepID=UPI001A8E669F|nr:hypothetical protein [Rhodobacter sp. NTK016B]MBN8290535.1 hypothetical protein [Rhodobacter sp. NTK016B]